MYNWPSDEREQYEISQTMQDTLEDRQRAEDGLQLKPWMRRDTPQVKGLMGAPDSERGRVWEFRLCPVCTDSMYDWQYGDRLHTVTQCVLCDEAQGIQPSGKGQ